jgi:hypothetical protein
VVQLENTLTDCHSEARVLSREESAVPLLAANSFLADKPGVGMTSGSMGIR